MFHDSTSQVIATRVSGCIIITLPADLLPEVIDDARRATLESLHRSGARMVVLEMSAVQVMDHEDFQSLHSITLMARLLGARSLWVGLRASIVLHLVDSNVDTSDVEAVRDLDEAFSRAGADDQAGTGVAAGEYLVDGYGDGGDEEWAVSDRSPAQEPQP